MAGEPGKPESEAILQAKAKARRIASAFEDVFGQPRSRTASQRLVLEHLETNAGDDGNSYRFSDAKDGIAIIAAGIHRDGAKSNFRIIERQVSLAAKAEGDAKPKPKVRSATS